MKKTNRKSDQGTHTSKPTMRSRNRKSLGWAIFAAIVLPTAFLLSIFSPSFNNLFTQGSSVNAAIESINTFAPDCTTSQTSWELGGTVCAKALGSPLGGQRRFMWVAPDGTVPQVATINSDPDTDSYTLPTTGAFAQTGRWIVKTVDRRGAGRVSATFEVLHPTLPNADLSVTKSGPTQITAGSNVTYTVTVTNNGPDAAQNVELDDIVPTHTTFVSETQDSGPPFTCANTTVDDITTTTCTIASLPANTTATFTFIYSVAANTAGGTIIFNEANVSSSTSEVNQFNNSDAATTTVGSATPCVLSCPSNVTQNNDANQCGAVVNYPAPSGSNCNGVTCTPPSGAFFPLGSSTVTCTGDTGDPCSFTVTVNDTQSHILVCPSNMTVNESPAGSGLATVNYTAPTTSACSGETITCDPASGSLFPIGTTTVTCSSNAGPSCNFTVTVNAFAGCVINCPASLTVGNDPGLCSATVIYATPTTSGPCSGTVTCTPASGSTFPVGSTVITCTDGAEASCSFPLNVLDTQEPTVVCPANISQPVDAGQCSTTVTYAAPTASDNCPGVGAVICTPASGSVFPSGVTEVTCSVNDAAGNPGSCSFTVSVTETQPPTISCPGDIALSNEPDECGAVVTYAAATGSDNCPGVTVSCSPSSDTFFPIGVTDVLCTATDAAGNTATCTFKVTVNDTQNPTISCPANVIQSNDQNQCKAVVNYASPTTGDNCPGVNTSCNPASGSEFVVGTTTVTCTATDGAGRTATCSFTVRVNDTQAPTITCPSNIAVGTAPNSSSATVNFQQTVSDNCTVATTSCSPASGSSFSVGTTTVNCTATDASNNQASCSFTVTVTDNQPPTITCTASIIIANDANQCGAVTTYPNPVVSDNSPGATASCSPASGSFFPVGTTQVTCTATDVGGNQATCSFSVTVKDTQAPVISCPANITVGNTPGLCSATVDPGVATAADNCPGVTVAGVRSDGLALNAPYPVGTTTIIWTASDGAVPANQATCTQTIVVQDTQAPTITVNPAVITMWPPNHQYRTFAISELVTSATDNCGGSLTASVTILKVTSDEGVIGDADIVIAANCKSVQLRKERLGDGDGRVYRVYFKVTDAAGNSTTVSKTVSVPHSQNGNPAVEGAVAYTVNSNCP
jgi:uncharacterized repeat protein (TIGR01451 family)